MFVCDLTMLLEALAYHTPYFMLEYASSHGIFSSIDNGHSKLCAIDFDLRFRITAMRETRWNRRKIILEKICHNDDDSSLISIQENVIARKDKSFLVSCHIDFVNIGKETFPAWSSTIFSSINTFINLIILLALPVKDYELVQRVVQINRII